jgi:hypothetical protein
MSEVKELNKTETSKNMIIEAQAVNDFFDMSSNYAYINKPYQKMLIELMKDEPQHSILAHTLFSEILWRRNNSAKSNFKNFTHAGVSDEKRVFSVDVFNLADFCLLTREKEYKDADESTKSYMKRKISASIKFLDKHNIFYFWKCGNYYIYYMEKNVALWTLYNPSAKLMPSVLIKIVNQFDVQTRIMLKKRRSVEKNVDSSDVKNKVNKSYVNFLQSIMRKMREDIAGQLLQISYNGDISKYIDDISNVLSHFKNYEGYTESKHFTERIPTTVKEALNKAKAEKYKEYSDEIPDAEIPEALRINKDPASTIHEREFPEGCDPFASPENLIFYYQYKLVSVKKAHCKFSNKLSQTQIDSASECLDTIKRLGWDKDDLDRWIRFFGDRVLTGKKLNKASNTSFTKFYASLRRYKRHKVCP